jgi:nucleotide-binding universal stress UspA family protein
MESSKSFEVVVGVDSSPSGTAALQWALAEARIRGGALRVVTAWHVPVLGGETPLDPAIFRDGAERAQKDAMSQVSADGVPVTTEVTEGLTAEVLLDAAKGSDLLVVGSRGRGGFKGMLLGSVSTHVVHHAPVPVLVVRSTVEDTNS